MERSNKTVPIYTYGAYTVSNLFISFQDDRFLQSALVFINGVINKFRICEHSRFLNAVIYWINFIIRMVLERAPRPFQWMLLIQLKRLRGSLA